jgi:SAM-dependent methyltransferase
MNKAEKEEKEINMRSCPLCFNNKELLKSVEGPDARAYSACNNCKLIFTETAFLPGEKSEKERYLTHNNGIQYKGYVKFLNTAIDPAIPFLKKYMHGLDFGCGPVPTLSLILEQKGFTCDDYDPFFFPNIPARSYDFIFATESFEHFFYPAKEISLIKDLLKPGGILIIMTETWKSTVEFTDWYYAKDFTHVSFFHIETFEFIAREFGFEFLKSHNDRVMVLRKK